MKTKRLQEVVSMVSSILADFTVHSKTLQDKNNMIVISCKIWDFYLTKLGDSGCYSLDDVKINDGDLAEEYSYTKKQIMREVFGRYCVTNSL